MSKEYIFYPQKFGHFAGFASTPTKDSQGDIIFSEAFIDSVKEWLNKGEMPRIHLEHTEKILGFVSTIEVTDMGLYIEGYLYPQYWEIIEALAMAPLGLSVAIKVKGAQANEGSMIITAADLIEVSFAADPINPEARTFVNVKGSR